LIITGHPLRALGSINCLLDHCESIIVDFKMAWTLLNCPHEIVSFYL
jgi:hypothetical protein